MTTDDLRVGASARRLTTFPERAATMTQPAADVVLLDCTTHARHDGGDHTILVGRVEEVVLGEGAPTVYFQSEFLSLEQHRRAASGPPHSAPFAHTHVYHFQ